VGHLVGVEDGRDEVDHVVPVDEREALVRRQETLTEKRLLVLGVNNRLLEPGRAYNNQQLVIVKRSIAEPAADLGSETRTVSTTAAIPAMHFRRGLSGPQFEALLQSRGLSNGQFAEQVEAALAEAPDDPRAAILGVLGETIPEPIEPIPPRRNEDEAEGEGEREFRPWPPMRDRGPRGGR